MRPRAEDAPATERFRWEYRYADDSDRLRYVADPLGHETEHRYDKDVTACVRSADGHEKRLAYDELHRLRAMTYPARDKELYRYDATRQRHLGNGPRWRVAAQRVRRAVAASQRRLPPPVPTGRR